MQCVSGRKDTATIVKTNVSRRYIYIYSIYSTFSRRQLMSMTMWQRWRRLTSCTSRGFRVNTRQKVINSTAAKDGSMHGRGWEEVHWESLSTWSAYSNDMYRETCQLRNTT